MEAGRREEADRALSDLAIKDGSGLIPTNVLVNLSGYPDNRGAIALFYAQSVSFTAWLVRTVGEEKFFAFLGDLKRGTAVESALQSVLRGSGKDWLQSVHDSYVKDLIEAAAKPK
jgi:hypothetical protein